LKEYWIPLPQFLSDHGMMPPPEHPRSLSHRKPTEIAKIFGPYYMG